MKKVIFILAGLLLGFTVKAQVVDSVTNGTLNVPSEGVTIVDTTTSVAAPSSSYSGYETETIRVYSGQHNGNNIIRTYEVPLPAESQTRRNRPY